MEPLHFEWTLDSASGGIEIPYEVPELFGKKKPPVLVTIRGGQEHTYRSTVAVYGGRYYVPLKKDNAAAAAITPGEPFEVTLVPDDEPRIITLPEDLAAALQESGLVQHWDRLSYSRQRERTDAVAAAKHTETRQRRIRRIIEQLGDSHLSGDE